MSNLLPRPTSDHALRLKGHCVAFVAAIGMILAALQGTHGAALPAGVGLTNPTLAFGLGGVSDWSTEMPFLDIAHTMRPWVGHKGKTWSAMTYEQLRDGGYLDEHGWLKRIPEGLDSVGTIWDWGGGAKEPATAKSRAGFYVLTYKGEGQLRVSGVKIIVAEPGHFVFQNPTGGTMGINILTTDPAGTGNYIRDLSVVPKKYAALAETGEMFNPDWLAVVQDVRQLRFMDWMETNQSTIADWSDRPEIGDATWAAKGVPVEVMVQLANQTGTEPWFNMPAMASDDYIREFATFVRDHLSPDLRAHVEYSNETWNWAFPHTHWLADQAKTIWATSDKAAWLDYAAKRATETALIWNQVFGDKAAARLDNVLAVQTVNPWAANRELTAPLWAAAEPDRYVSPASVFHSLAVTTYFGVSSVANADRRAELVQTIQNTPGTATAWLAGKLVDPAYEQSIPQIASAWAAMKAIAEQYDLDLVAYEGGQHVQHSFAVAGLSETDLSTLTDFLTGFVRSAEMAGLYSRLWDEWTQVSDGPFMQFVDVGAASKYGSWGMLSALGDSNPRADFLMKKNASERAWFGDGGGTRYQQGVIVMAGDAGGIVSGTEKDDFLVGGTVDDTFIAGLGHDGINGGDGVDAVVLNGTLADYSLSREGSGYRLSGPGISDFVVGVEQLRFSDGTTKSLE